MRYVHDKPMSKESEEFQKGLYENQTKSLFGSIVASTVSNEVLKQVFGVDDALTPAPIPESLLGTHNLANDEANGRTIWRLTPKSSRSDKVIFYFHGGGYVVNISSAHWNYLEALSSGTGATLVVTDYPLAPRHTATDAYACMETAYDKLASGVSSDKIVVMGDSAGGGMALGFVHQRRKDGKSVPGQVIVLSPWLDASLANPDIDAVEDRDHLLGTRGLIQAGRAYAGKLDMSDYRVSPMFGNYEGYPPLSIFQGTHDLLLPDARKLVDQFDKAGLPYNYYEYPGQSHVWAMFGFPESDAAIKQIVKLISG